MKRRAGKNIDNSIVRKTTEACTLRLSFKFVWNEMLLKYHDTEFVLQSDPEHRLVLTWMDPLDLTNIKHLKNISEEKPLYNLEYHVSGLLSREQWNRIYSLIKSVIVVKDALISFETDGNHLPYLKFYCSEIHSSQARKILELFPEIELCSIVANHYILTTVRLVS